MPKKTITIMADFGNGPYAWLKDSSDQSKYVGGNIADAISGFSGYAEVSRELEIKFAEWVTDFENHSDERNFDWKAFNERGIALSNRLKGEVKDAFDIVYVVQSEDLMEETWARLKITGG